MDKLVMVFTMFLVLTLGLVASTPDLFIDGANYDPSDVELPDYFDAPFQQDYTASISHNLTTGLFVRDFGFMDEYNISMRIQVSFNRYFDDVIRVFTVRPFTGPTLDRFAMSPNPVTQTLLETSWVSEDNVSRIEFSLPILKIDGEFRDSNSSRNNITSAFDAREINCTIIVPNEWDIPDKNDLFGATDLVFALLTFNLDSVFTDIDPVFGFVISGTVMVPLIFVFYSVALAIVHGENG